MADQITILSPGEPVKGMISGRNPASIPQGYFSQLTNLRFGQSQLQVRQGLQKLTSAVPSAGASLRGAWAGTLQGVFTIIAAYRIGNYTLLYSCNTSTYAWTEITHDGSIDGRNGNTRFPADGWIAYAVVRDQAGKEVLVAQNGTDQPRVYDPSGTVHEQVAVSQVITPPNDTTLENAILDFPYWVNLYENGTRSQTTYSASAQVAISAITPGSTTTITTASAHGFNTGDYASISGLTGTLDAANGFWLLTVTSTTTFTIGVATSGSYTTGGYVYGRISFYDQGNGQALTTYLGVTTNTQTGDNTTIDFYFSSGAYNLSLARQLVMICSTSYASLWLQVKIEAGSHSGVYSTIWDPTTSVLDPVYVVSIDPTNENTYCVGFSLDNVDTTSAAITAFSRLRFTWMSASPPTTYQLTQILMVAASGTIEGNMEYGINFSNSDSRAESYGVILGEPTCAYIESLGGNPSNGVRIPNSNLLYYRSTINYQMPSAAELTFGTDTLNVFRQDYGELDLTFCFSKTIGSYTSGAWVTTNAEKVMSTPDTTLVNQKNLSRQITDSYHQPIPRGNSMLYSGGRLYVGGAGSAKNEVWVSEENSETRFRTDVRFLSPTQADPSSPLTDNFSGEIVTALAKGAGRLVGVDPIFVFTQGNLYRLDGLDATSLSRPTKISASGCLYPRTLAEHSGDLYWVNNEQQVSKLSGSSVEVISQYKVDDRLTPTSLSTASGAWLNYRYYLGYAPTGSLNTKVLVYEEEYNEFCEDTLEAGDAGQLVQLDDPVSRKVYSFSSAGHIYRIEAPGQSTDDGTPLTIVITTPEIHDGYWTKIQAGRIGMVTDDYTGSLTVSRQFKPSGYGNIGVSGTINLTTSADTAWRWEYATNGVQPGGSALSCIASVTGQLPSAMNIYCMVMEYTALSTGGADSGN